VRKLEQRRAPAQPLYARRPNRCPPQRLDALAAEPFALQPSDHAPAKAPSRTKAAPAGLLLKDATLEDIVRHLHGQNIEPTFRFLAPQ
jgi:hypothetical protein